MIRATLPSLLPMYSGRRRTKIQGGAKRSHESHDFLVRQVRRPEDKSYRCDERDLACRADGRHDKNRTKDGGVRKRRSRVASHREWVDDGNEAASRLV
jgi:hypothetical protein